MQSTNLEAAPPTLSTYAALLANTVAAACQLHDGVSAEIAGVPADPRRSPVSYCSHEINVSHVRGGRALVTVEIVAGGYLIVDTRPLPPFLRDAARAAMDRVAAAHDLLRHNPGVFRAC